MVAADGWLDTLQQQGFRIPQDVSVVGFGDGVLATYYHAPLTTVRERRHVDLAFPLAIASAVLAAITASAGLALGRFP